MNPTVAAVASLIWIGIGGMAHAADESAPLMTASIGTGTPTAQATTPKDDGTAQQISAWISSDGDGSVQQGDGASPSAPRAIHGEVGVDVGSDGFSREYGVADVPVGQSSDLVVAASNTTAHLRGRGSVQGQSLSVGLYLNGASPNAQPPCASPQAGAGPTFGPGPWAMQGTPPTGYAPAYQSRCERAAPPQ